MRGKGRGGKRRREEGGDIREKRTRIRWEKRGDVRRGELPWH
jgi:hypothetical protein